MKQYPRRIKYEINKRYQSFIIKNQSPTTISKTGRTYTNWECLCDCGKIFVTTTKQIQKGKKSCGCLSISNRFKKLPARELITNLKLGHYKNSAKRRNLRWELNNIEFEKFLFSSCFYCNIPPILEVKRNGRSILTNGIDRKDNSKGYVLDNCVTCCHFCNTAKLNYKLDDFLNWIKRIKNEKNNIDK